MTIVFRPLLFIGQSDNRNHNETQMQRSSLNRFKLSVCGTMMAVSPHVNHQVYSVKWFSDENSPHILKLCYVLAWNQIEAEALRQGKLIFFGETNFERRQEAAA